MSRARFVIALAFISAVTFVGSAQTPPARSAPDRISEGEGPFDRLVIRGITVIDGTGAPPQSPVDVVVEQNRIAEVKPVGFPGVPIDPQRRPAAGTKEIDGTGKYLMPGFVDLHAHTAAEGQAGEAEYVYKLWLAHGVTSTRGLGYGPLEWSLNERARSRLNQIVAPRMFIYQVAFRGDGWDVGAAHTPDNARAWVRWAAKRGVDGIKVAAHDPEVMEALLSEAQSQMLGSTAHLDQLGVVRMNALQATRLGLRNLEHFYGLFESLLRDSSLQAFPSDFNNTDEQQRFAQVARLASQIHPRGSQRWQALIDEWVAKKIILDPTLGVYSANRDVMRARNADWHSAFTLPILWEFFQPGRLAHGSYWRDWTTSDEIAWRTFYSVWMTFLNDFKNAGGRVTAGSDSGYMYQTYGFGYIQELEMLQEAGFSPLEVIRAATLHGAQAIAEPTGRPIDFGLIRRGLLADMIVLDENPLQNLKVLYGTGVVRLNDATARADRVPGIRYTIKDGIVYDVPRLLNDVQALVTAARERGAR